MPLMDEFKEERDLVKNRSFKEKMSYFWDYYKWHVIAGVVCVFIVFSLVHTILNRKDTAFYAALINMAEITSSTEYKEEFARRGEVDLQKSTVYFDVDMHLDLSSMDDVTTQTSQKIMVYISGKELDVMLGDLEAINLYSYNGVLSDLRDFLTEEEYAKYEPYFYYMDRAVLEALEDDPTVDYPTDPMDPETMKDPVPMAILLPETPKFDQIYAHAPNIYYAVIVNSGRPELSHLFLEYITEN